jgi:sn-glycerol 3-phosphate transport system ATP-binding protein/multiple sugar transport system ATP-binding protein
MTLADVMFVLNEGKVEQQGAPLDVYDAPATRFVAGFLGSPAMNFLEGRVERADGRWQVRLDADAAIDVAPERFTLADGDEVVIGVRPHDLQLGGSLRFEVSVAEALGGETYAHGSIAGQPVTVRLEADRRVKTGEEVELAPSVVHLFDRKSGRSLRC